MAGGGLGYIPPASKGCPANVKVQMQASSQSGGWFSGRPSVDGRVTVLNGESYSVPVQDVQVMVFPANSPVAPVYSGCWGIGSGSRVPSSPIPFQYGRSSCTFQASLPSNGPSAGARNWQQARAVVTLTNGAKCYSDMTNVDYQGGGGGWPWGNIIGGSSSGGGGGWGIGSSGPGSSGGLIGGASPMGGSGGGLIGGARPTGSSGTGGLIGGANPMMGGSSSGGSGGGLGSARMVGSANPTSGGGGGNRKLLSE
jgi:hypothetical protein